MPVPQPLTSVTGQPPVILFDGHCLMCSGSVRWIHKRDPGMHFRFAAQQSPEGAGLRELSGLRPVDSSSAGGSLVVVERATGNAQTGGNVQTGGKVRVGSDAALHIARHLKAPWSWLGMLRIIPRPLRDALYYWIARNRYRWAGRSETCFMPDDSLRKRFDIQPTACRGG